MHGGGVSWPGSKSISTICMSTMSLSLILDNNWHNPLDSSIWYVGSFYDPEMMHIVALDWKYLSDNHHRECQITCGNAVIGLGWTAQLQLGRNGQIHLSFSSLASRTWVSWWFSTIGSSLHTPSKLGRWGAMYQLCSLREWWSFICIISDHLKGVKSWNMWFPEKFIKWQGRNKKNRPAVVNLSTYPRLGMASGEWRVQWGGR